MNGAQSYLASGPPYFGRSDFKDLEVIKKAGGQWNGARKMWKAPDESSLRMLIETEKWHPDGSEGRYILMAMRINDERKKKEAREAAHREAEVEKKKKAEKKKADGPTPEQLEAKQRKDTGILDDTPEQLARLVDEYQITPAMLKCTFNWGSLGPKGGLSDAGRVLRGLKHNIVTKEEIQNGVQNENEFDKKRKTTEDSGQQQKTPPVTARKKACATSAPPMNPYSKEAMKLHWKTQDTEQEDCTKVVTTTTAQLCSTTMPIKWVRDTECGVCKCPVTDQFLSCDCFDAVWVRCANCGGKYRTDDQPRNNSHCLCNLAKHA